MRVLGLSAFHRDSAAALLVDGRLVAAAQEERFTRKPLDASFPRRAARFCLDRAGLRADELDAVVFYEKPLRKFERTLAAQLQAFPRSSKSFAKGMFLWLGDRLWLKTRIAEEIAIPAQKVFFVEHQRAHAAAAFYASPFEEAAILTLDDLGEWATASLARGNGSKIELLSELHFPHSLGLWYSAFAQFLGFEPGLDEERLEALARFGSPRFDAEVGSTLPAGTDGACAVDANCFRFAYDAERLFDGELERRLGPPRKAGSPLAMSPSDSRDADLAASVQHTLEARVLALAEELYKRASSKNLCLAGEVARNRSLVARLAAESHFESIFVPPAPGEPGAAIGAAFEYAFSIRDQSRGGALDDWRAGESIDSRAESGAVALGSVEAARTEIAKRVADGALVAWVRGAVELGPRSFGNRVILADARGDGVRERLLASVQQAESYMLCRVVAPRERAEDWFEVRARSEKTLRFAHSEVRAKPSAAKVARSLIGPDERVWLQTVDASDDPELHALLHAIGQRTGAPLVAMSDFRLRGQPIVRNEADAVDAFRRSALDALFAADRVYERSAT